MEYLYKLVNLLNQFDGNDRKVENEIRDLICFISDDPNYMANELYRNIIFEDILKELTKYLKKNFIMTI